MGKQGDQPEQKETALEIENAKVAKEQWDLYNEVYRPTENKFIADVTAPSTGREARMASMTSADTAERLPTRIDPNRIRTMTPVAATAGTVGRLQTAANQGVKNQRLSGMQTVVDLGQGKAATAALGFSKLAEDSIRNETARREMSEAYRTAKRKEIGSTIGAVAGAGFGMYRGMKGSGDLEFITAGPQTYVGG